MGYGRARQRANGPIKPPPLWDGRHGQNASPSHGEQGLGDEILFMSLFNKTRPFADKIVVECATRLVDIFEDLFGVKCYPTHQKLIEAEGEPDALYPDGFITQDWHGLPDGKPFLAGVIEPARISSRPLTRHCMAWRYEQDE